MVAILDPYPRWQRATSGDIPPTLGGCEMLAARWTGSVDDPCARTSLRRAVDQALQALAVDALTLVEAMPDEVEATTLRASDVLGPWPTAPEAVPLLGGMTW